MTHVISLNVGTICTGALESITPAWNEYYLEPSSHIFTAYCIITLLITHIVIVKLQPKVSAGIFRYGTGSCFLIFVIYILMSAPEHFEAVLQHYSKVHVSPHNGVRNHWDMAGGRRSPAVACWASDHWVAISNPLRGKFRHLFRLIIPGICLAQFSLSNVHKIGLKHHNFISLGHGGYASYTHTRPILHPVAFHTRHPRQSD